ncbi:60S acidic ribosomal protein P2 isoform X2 [Numida meleagris]|uniref:60S acidic ribosomal protein P2 isoform X2 n=1 Tax=Numida meleagris TaxID=8996 RepID=UPI000B3E34A9|nr:60S acidic ribosomal protein P2 isoform X2 [Numida meleagris]
MRYVAAYLLAVLGGNESPTSKDLKKILDSVGIETDDERLNKVISELNGKNIEDVIAQVEDFHAMFLLKRLKSSRSILTPSRLVPVPAGFRLWTTLYWKT